MRGVVNDYVIITASEWSDQDQFSPIKILDPGRKRFYKRRVCD